MDKLDTLNKIRERFSTIKGKLETYIEGQTSNIDNIKNAAVMMNGIGDRNKTMESRIANENMLREQSKTNLKEKLRQEMEKSKQTNGK